LEVWDSTIKKGLNLDMTRGKPASEQLDLIKPLLLDTSLAEDYRSEDNTDCRNYGNLDGLSELKRFFAQYLDVTPDNVLIGGNSSLSLMHDTMASLCLFGAANSDGKNHVPWNKDDSKKVKFLCPVPGYDRHFSLCEKFGIEMIPVPLKEDGPDLSIIKPLVATDATVKGIWCVPKYSNPTGIVYSADVIKELAAMPTAANDFRIFWDNAYQAHHLYDRKLTILDVLTECARAGNPDRVFIYGSTSKITFPGAGIAVMASSPNNLKWFKKLLFAQTIGPDKINQLRHIRFLKNMSNLEDLMNKHAAIMRPKFASFSNTVKAFLGPEFTGLFCSEPQGGYFINLTLGDNLSAQKIVSLANQCGLKLTPAGATHPYGKDPDDATIRIAPSMPVLADITKAARIVALCCVIAKRKLDV
jgi:DNA-binding transcriptional MocR family regulator